jgi:hypothetical protein
VSNHVIYDRIWVSQKLAKCSLKAALAYPWLYLIADDWGRFEYLPRVIWGRAFGAREDVRPGEVEAWLGEYERAGLLDVYNSEGRRVGAWTNFSGPPPSKRRAPTLPDKDGVYEREGFKYKSRFHSPAPVLPNRSMELELEQELELEREEEARQPPTSRSRSSGEGVADATAQELEALARDLEGRTGKPSAQWLARASLIEADASRGARSFDDPRAAWVTEAWAQVTLRKMRELREQVSRPLPL